MIGPTISTTRLVGITTTSTSAGAWANTTTTLSLQSKRLMVRSTVLLLLWLKLIESATVAASTFFAFVVLVVALETPCAAVVASAAAATTLLHGVRVLHVTVATACLAKVISLVSHAVRLTTVATVLLLVMLTVVVTLIAATTARVVIVVAAVAASTTAVPTGILLLVVSSTTTATGIVKLRSTVTVTGVAVHATGITESALHTAGELTTVSVIVANAGLVLSHVCGGGKLLLLIVHGITVRHSGHAWRHSTACVGIDAVVDSTSSGIARGRRWIVQIGLRRRNGSLGCLLWRSETWTSSRWHTDKCVTGIVHAHASVWVSTRLLCGMELSRRNMCRRGSSH